MPVPSYGADAKKTKKKKRLKPLAYGYSSESAQRELCNDFEHGRVWDSYQKSLGPCAMDESSLSIGKVKLTSQNVYMTVISELLHFRST